MSSELVTTNEMVHILIDEAKRRRVTLALIFAAVALIALMVGLFWPKKYVSSTTILVQDSSIIKPLMEGRAVPTGVADRASIAREVIFSRKIMDEVLNAGGWLATSPAPSPVQQEQIIDGIKHRTTINSYHDNLIQIDYADSDPDRSYKVVTLLADQFIKESLAAKEQESKQAYDFINTQVEQYHGKLIEAENNLKALRAKNPDARPGSATDSNTRVAELRSQIEAARLALMESNSKAGSLNAQLSGESAMVITQTREGQYRVRLADLQNELDKLLLTYTDKHPDVIRIRHEMEDLREQLVREQSRNALGGGSSSALAENAVTNPVYLDLRTKQADASRDAAAAAARMGAGQSLLNAELERGRRIADSESSLAELSRDYEVNRDTYQDLLKRRENARVSMNLDAEHEGLAFAIQEPAVKPLQPVGLRFMHFGLAGLAIGIALPLLLLFAFARFDTRLKSGTQLERLTGVPVLASIPVYTTREVQRRSRANTVVLGLVLSCVFLAYVLATLIRLKML